MHMHAVLYRKIAFKLFSQAIRTVISSKLLAEAVRHCHSHSPGPGKAQFGVKLDEGLQLGVVLHDQVEDVGGATLTTHE